MSIIDNIFSSSKKVTRRRLNVPVSNRSNFPVQRIRKISAPVVKEQSVSKRGFDVAVLDRTNLSWKGSQSSINWDIRNGLGMLRARSRDLAMNDPYFKKFLRLLEKNIIGPNGFTHRNKAFDWLKGPDGQYKKEFDKLANTLIQEGFWEWSRIPYCYVTGNMSFREGNGLEIKTMAVDGEVFIKRIYTKNTRENPFGITYQLIEAAYCDETLNKILPNGNVIIMGIEYDLFRRPVAYYFRKIKSGTELYNPYASKEYARITADQIMHLYIPEFVGQLRGIPWCAPTAMRLHLLKGYEEAALMNARSAARKTMVIEPIENKDGEINTATVAGGEEDEEGNIIQNVAPGETFIVPRGYKSAAFDPNYPQGEHGSFTQTILQGVSSGWDVDFPSLSSNLSNVNYTSTRHGLLDARLGYQILQSYFREHRLEITAADWLESAIMNNYFAVQLPISKFNKFNQPQFLGYVGEWVDKYKDTKGILLDLSGNLTTLEIELAKRGLDCDEVLERRAQEVKMLQEYGLTTKDMTQDLASNGGDGNDGTERKMLTEESVIEILENYIEEHDLLSKQ